MENYYGQNIDNCFIAKIDNNKVIKELLGKKQKRTILLIDGKVVEAELCYAVMEMVMENAVISGKFEKVDSNLLPYNKDYDFSHLRDEEPYVLCRQDCEHLSQFVLSKRTKKQLKSYFATMS